MGITIKEINVQNLGPIREISWKIGKVNLIYGDNEKGKSYLVEFLIRSLFKTAGWKLRTAIGSGKVKVAGIEDNITEFSPATPKKLEDFLSKRYTGLPPDFSKLLVVKGTEVELGEVGETDKVMLRRYLSHKETLSKIQENISKTIQDSNVDGYKISGRQMGEIKKREDLKTRLKRIDELFKDIENQYLGGYRKILEDKKQTLESKIKQLLKAKRYRAYEISMKIKNLRNESNNIDEQKLDGLLKKISEYNGKNKDYQSKETKRKELFKSTEHYKWLENAIKIYEQYNLGAIIRKPGLRFLLLLIGMIIAAGVFAIFHILIGTLISLVGMALVGWLYKRKYDQSLADAGKSQEVQKLEKEYKERFSEDLTNLPLMQKNLESMEEDYNEREVLKKQLNDEKNEIDNFKDSISKGISEFFGREIALEEWEGKLKEKQNKKKRLEEQINQKNIELATLNVNQTEYETEKPDVEFDEEEYSKTENSLSEVKDGISKMENTLGKLKQVICEHTGDDISMNWTELIKNLANKRDEILKEYKNITAEIIGQKFVFEVVERLYKAEDEMVKSTVESDDIKKTLFEVTTHYDSITLEGDNIRVSDPYNDFPLSEISDGAKEQVLLALRVGFAMSWFKKDGLFLILDDAFLHSDYKRRSLLVNKIVELANRGWQIICFTFDDNIKELLEKVKPEFGGEYRYFDLNVSKGQLQKFK